MISWVEPVLSRGQSVFLKYTTVTGESQTSNPLILSLTLSQLSQCTLQISKGRCTSVLRKFPKVGVLQSLKIIYILANSADPDEMPHFVAFHLDLHFLPSTSSGVFSLQRVPYLKVKYIKKYFIILLPVI